MITDWSTRYPGVVQTVWVQCKHTGREKAPAAEICRNVWEAALARSEEAYRDVHLFIVASSAPNDADLHDQVAALQHELLFKVEVHSWVTLCNCICDSDRLWDRYNRFRNEDTASEFRLDRALLSSRLRGFLRTASLDEANNWSRHDKRAPTGYCRGLRKCCGPTSGRPFTICITCYWTSTAAHTTLVARSRCSNWKLVYRRSRIRASCSIISCPTLSGVASSTASRVFLESAVD